MPGAMPAQPGRNPAKRQARTHPRLGVAGAGGAVSDARSRIGLSAAAQEMARSGRCVDRAAVLPRKSFGIPAGRPPRAGDVSGPEEQSGIYEDQFRGA